MRNLGPRLAPSAQETIIRTFQNTFSVVDDLVGIDQQLSHPRWRPDLGIAS